MSHERIELLIARVCAGEATDADWDRLIVAAADEPDLWRQVAEAQRDHADLADLMASAGAVADRVDLPHPEVIERLAAERSLDARLRGWGGWAVAALVTVILALRWAPGASSGPAPSPNASNAITAGYSAHDALRHYIDQGQRENLVIRELPRHLLVETRPAPDGSVELIYIRQIMERVVVPDIYRYRNRDETGYPVPVRYEVPVGGRM